MGRPDRLGMVFTHDTAMTLRSLQVWILRLLVAELSRVDDREFAHGAANLDWALFELHELRSNAFKLAVDDQYVAAGLLTVDAAQGLLANDLDQEYRVITVDSCTQPTAGTRTVEAD